MTELERLTNKAIVNRPKPELHFEDFNVKEAYDFNVMQRHINQALKMCETTMKQGGKRNGHESKHRTHR